MENIPWIEKYRPHTFNDITFHCEIKKNINHMIKTGKLMNMIFVGNMGSGKSSTARVISKEMYGDQEYLMTQKLNASDQRGVNEIRERIDNFASASFNVSKIRMVILDEADAMTIDAQLILSQLIDKYKNKLVFCIICNYIRKIHSSIKSRCILFRFNSLSNESIKERLKLIIAKENINLSDDILFEIAKESKGDMRRAINILYTVNFDKELTVEKIYHYIKIPSEKISNKIINILIGELSLFEKNKKVQFTIREYGYNIFQILDIIIKYVNKEKLWYLLPELAKIEMNLSGDFSENIQLAHLISLLITL